MGVARLHTSDARVGAFVGVISTVPSIALLLGAGDQDSLARMVHVSGLVSYGLVLGAAVLTYFHWRMVSVTRGGELDERLARWLTVGLTAAGINGLLQVAMRDSGRDGWAVIGQLALVLLLCAVAAVADHVDVPGDPVLVCTVAAVAIPSAYGLALLVAPPLDLGAIDGTMLNLVYLVTSLMLVWVVLGRTEVSLWARRRLSAAALLLTAAQCTANLDHQHSVLMAGAIAAYLLGALLLCSMAQQMLRGSVLDSQSEIELLQRSLTEVRADIRQDRELLHEVGATLAGITTASRVMRQPGAVTSHRRQRLESMLNAELARLERLMQRRVEGLRAGEDHAIWLDDIIEPVVVSHQERGRLVSWQPCGEEAFGNPDELAEVCNILLENAARHGGGGPVTLSVDAYSRGVEIICSDEGPGVSPEDRDRIFDAEVKGAGSQGQGLGLAIARRLASARGGRLQLLDDGRPGATFVALFPAKVVADEQACHVA
jgi:signal transduction histidine kinase